MATVLSTLYPPLIDTFMPAFPYDENVTVEFSISPYNTANMINYLHISLVNQKTNQNAFEGSMSGLGENTPEILSGTYLVNGVWIVPFGSNNVLSCDKDNLWHLTIPKILLKNQDNNPNNKVFTIDYYYKLQLRFDSCTDSSDLSSAVYLTKNRVYFSEWSSVCLLKAIPHIDCFLKNFDDREAWGTEFSNEAVQTPQYTPGSINITGYLSFSDGTSSEGDSTKTTTNHGEYLKSFEIQTYNDQGELIDSIDPQFTAYLAEKNDFSYLLDVHSYPTDKIYKLRLIFITNNNYTFIKDYHFSIINYQSDFSPTWNFKTKSIFAYGAETEEVVTEEDGIIEFTVNCGVMKPGYLYIRRESRLDNWASSELIKCQGFLEGQSNAVVCSVKDDTVASLVGYRYSVQYQTLNNAWTTLRYSQEIYPNFHNILIKRGNKQLAIRYNAQISSMTPVKTRVKIDTLGGKYPKFAENANLNYKQFTISGLISAESDFNRTFLNELATKYEGDLIRYDNNMGGKYMIRNDTVVEEEDGTYGTYNKWIMNPDTYTKQGVRDLKIGRKKVDSENVYNPSAVSPHDIYPLENWWWERIFREKVVEWLNDGEPKLWRSMTEGNMVVMFDGISLTPNAQLGRRTWNFSATVYEVEDGYNLNTLSSLGIYNVQNDYQENTLMGITEQIEGTEYNLGQLYRVQGTEEGTSIRALIEEKINMLYRGVSSNYSMIKNSMTLNSVKIYFHRDNDRRSTSHWYKIKDGVPRLIGDPEWSINDDKIESEKDFINPIKESVNNNYILGYRLEITPITNQIRSTEDTYIQAVLGNTFPMFVNERGYYQTPAGTNIWDIKLYDNQIATVEYFVQWNTKYNDAQDPSSYEVGEEIIGQVSGWWRAGSNINTLIYNKYYGQDITNIDYDDDGHLTIYTGKTQELEYWKASDFDVTPYTMFNIKQVGENLNAQKIMVGRTGTLRLETESTFPMNQCIVLGKRMFRASDDRQPYLDEWEYVLDSSVYQGGSGEIVDDGEYWYALLDEDNWYKTDVLVKVYFDADQDGSSIDDSGYQVWDLDDFRIIYDDWRTLGESFYTSTTIKKPEYNTVYGVVDENGIFSYKLYYLDGGWYDVEFEDINYSTMLAKVPINGVINYKGNLIRKMYT